MAVKCDICGKTSQVGNRVSHSKRHTKRRWHPNLHSVALRDGATNVRKKICTRCMRTLNKA